MNVEFEGVADPRMLEAFSGAKRFRLDLDGGDKAFELDASYEEMIEVGAIAIARTRPTLVMITAYDTNNMERTIMFNPSNGDWNLEGDDWVDNRLARVMLEINEPCDVGLWRNIGNLGLTIETNTISNEWEFRGRYTDLVKFLKDYYTHDVDEEMFYQLKETIDII